MAYLYYENLPDVYSSEVAISIMSNTYNAVKPYIDFIEKIRISEKRKIISLIVDYFPLEDLLAEERELIRNQMDEELKEDEYEIERNYSKQLKRVIKLVNKGEGVLYKILEDEDDEGFDRKKERFLNAEKVYPNRSLRSPKRIEVLTSYSPYDILVLKSKDLKGDNTRRRLFLRANLSQYGIIRDSLEQLLNKPVSHNRNLIRLFENTNNVKFNNFTPIKLNEDEWIFLTDNNRSGNSMQREFVEIALNTPDYAILEGPPGSGKTTTICELIFQALKQGKRILLVASTHVAVDNVLEKLMDEKTDLYNTINNVVLPIRIGRTDRISDQASKYHLDAFWLSKSEELRNKISRIKDKTKSQRMFLELLNNRNLYPPEYSKRVFVRAANLVCGTTIGILKHPEIQKLQRQNKVTNKPYDYLILDEASKTTFQEFLVPALLAEKFIIVGDVKQLAPFVDEEGVTGNVSMAHPNEGEFIALINNIRNAQNSHKKPIKCLKVLNKNLTSVNEDKILALEKAFSIPIYLLKENQEIDKTKLFGSTLIMGTINAISNYSRILPLGINWISLDDSQIIHISESKFLKNIKQFQRKHSYVKNKLENHNNAFSNDENWNDAVSWRLIRDFELRNLNDDRYLKQIEHLLPNYMDEKERTKILKVLNQIKRLSFPSIIELLQKGFERNRKQIEKDIGLSITDGLSKTVLKSRHRILKFQHRMHPEISSFPRTNLYDKEALFDLPDIQNDRVFSYDNYSNRSLWIDVQLSSKEKRKMKKNKNEKEAQVIVNEIKELLDFTKDYKKPDNSPWEIAILPFYNSQESLIRKKLQSMFKTRRIRTFYAKNKNAIIELCVVDRFQGHEADIVFLSLVKNRGLGFLDTPNRLNVALTRAKYQLLIVGNKNHFSNQKRSELLRKLAVETPKKMSYGDVE